MSKYFPFILLLLAVNIFGQNKASINNDSKTDLSNCYPSRNLSTIMQSKDNRSYRSLHQLSEQQTDSLRNEELLVYVHEYPESFRQICAKFPLMGNKDNKERIKPFIPSKMEGYLISERQRKALAKRKTAIVPLIDSCITQHHRIHDDLKQTIVYLKAYELVPTIVNILKNSNEAPDYYLYTLLMLLMKNDSYKGFTSSTIYQKLYDAAKNTQGIKPTKATCDFIIATANNYYTWKKLQPLTAPL